MIVADDFVYTWNEKKNCFLNLQTIYRAPAYIWVYDPHSVFTSRGKRGVLISFGIFPLQEAMNEANSSRSFVLEENKI